MPAFLPSFLNYLLSTCYVLLPYLLGVVNAEMINRKRAWTHGCEFMCMCACPGVYVCIPCPLRSEGKTNNYNENYQ